MRRFGLADGSAGAVTGALDMRSAPERDRMFSLGTAVGR